MLASPPPQPPAPPPPAPPPPYFGTFCFGEQSQAGRTCADDGMQEVSSAAMCEKAVDYNNRSKTMPCVRLLSQHIAARRPIAARIRKWDTESEVLYV